MYVLYYRKVYIILYCAHIIIIIITAVIFCITVSLATKDVDYTGLPNNIVFASGQTTGARSCINITIINDNLKEEKEYFNVNLMSSLPGAKLVSTRSTIEITDTSGGQSAIVIISSG